MEDIKWCPQHGYPLPCDKCGMPLSQLQQKEIYQSGIREVVEWFREELGGEYPFDTQLLDDKLREWGVDKPKK